MSNRLIGILIIFGFIISGFLFYLYAFLHYTGTIEFQGNVSEYHIKLHNTKTFNTFTKSCTKNPCIVPDLPPFTYTLTVTQKLYKPFIKQIILQGKESKKISFSLEKDTQLEYNEIPIVPKNQSLLRQEKIRNIYNSTKYYAYFKIKNLGELFFVKNKKQLSLHLRDETGRQKRISFFSTIIAKKNIHIRPILHDDEMFFLEYGTQKFLYNHSTAHFTEIPLHIPIIYIKKSHTNYIHFVTKQGTFIYNNKKLTYLDVFSDFVLKDSKYIGLIQSNDTRRKKDFKFLSEGGSLIVLYDPKLSDAKIIYKPSFIVDKITLEYGNVLIFDTSGKKFTLKNY